MRILVLSSWHGTMEYDELTILSELGHDWFSTGLYADPQNPLEDHAKRQKINKVVDSKLLKDFYDLNRGRKVNGPVIVTKNFVDNFDLVIAYHCCPYPFFIRDNWEAIKHKPIIWRTYCQQNSANEFHINEYKKKGNITVVRVSSKEQTIPGAMEAIVVRPYVDEEIYTNWEGNNKTVLTFNSFYNRRSLVSNTKIYTDYIRSEFKCELYGCYSDNHPDVIGYLDWQDQVKKYQEHRVYFALGSKPAAITYNFMEALMTGSPVVTWGPKLGNFPSGDWSNTYEVSDIVTNGVNGFWSDDPSELQEVVALLLNNKEIAQEISTKGRELALKLFSKKAALDSWKALFSNLNY